MGYSITKDFLSLKDLNIVTEEANFIFKDRNSRYKTNLTHWHSNIVLDSKAVLIYNLQPNNCKSFNIISKYCQQHFNLIPLGVMFYYWTQGSYIPWHNDGHFKKAGTLYLNENWDKDWGGLYLATENQTQTIIIPKSNLFTLQFDNMFHSTTPTSTTAPIRITAQMFF